MPRRRRHPALANPRTGEPAQVTVTVIACLLILLVFVVMAALV